MIVLLHLPVASHFYSMALVRNAFHFVDFFFVLSGFIIANVYFEQLRNGFGFVRFTLLRFGRLYPLHAFVLGIFAVWYSLRMLGGSSLFDIYMVEDLALDFLLLNSMGLQDSWSWSYPSWSIGAEFCSYLLFAAVVVWTGRFSNWVFLLVMAVCAGILAYIAPRGIGSNADFGVVRGLYGFLLGYFVWRAHEACNGRQIRPRLDRLLGVGGWTVLEIVTTVVGIVVVVLPLSREVSLLTPVAFSAMVLVFAQQRGWMSSLLMARGLQRLGELSYSIYLLHAVVIALMVDAFSLYHAVVPYADPVVRVNDHSLLSMNLYLGDLVTLIALGLTVFLSRMTHRSIEQSGRGFFRRLADGQINQPVKAAVVRVWRSLLAAPAQVGAAPRKL